MPDNSYDEIRFCTLPQPQTHPDRLAAVGTLFGMDPAPARECRVLEIGCGDGGNLIPMAYGLARSRFVGIDLAEAPIAAGRRSISALGLSNISLIQGDLREIGPEHGEFDYIIAPGLYSWVPAEVRDRLVGVCAERLAPRGIAFLSYNAYPGQYARRMFRDMMLFHTRQVMDSAERIQLARGFLGFLRDSCDVSPTWKTFLSEEVRTLLERHPGGLFHDDLSETNHPVYFRDFVKHADEYALQYLSEAEPSEAFDPLGEVANFSEDPLEREQYMDFLRGRRFRQTLLCRREVPLCRQPGPDLMPRFLFSAPFQVPAEGQLEGLRGVCLGSPHPTVERLVRRAGQAFPLPVRFDEFLPEVGNRAVLSQVLLHLVTSGFADIHSFDFPCERTVTARPQASALARHMAAASGVVVNVRHQVVELDELSRRLIVLLDGSRDREQLVRDLDNTPGRPAAEYLREHLSATLGWMAGMGLLER